MSTDEYKKLCDNLNTRIVLHQTIKEPISQDLDNLIKLSVAYDKLQEENAELKKQLENCYCNRTDCSGRIKDSKVYDSLVQKVKTQQKEFINYLEDEIKTLEKDILETVDDVDIYMKQVKSLIIEEILQKYKSMIGVSDENNKQ